MTQEFRVWAFALGLTAIGLVQACATSKPAKSPECGDEQLAKIEAAFVAEATAACSGKTYDNCPQLPAIRDKYSAMRQGWVQCSK